MTTLYISGIEPTLQDKLVLKAEEYKKCTEFADKIPLFADRIILSEATGEFYFKLADRYKETYFAWGINWQVNKAINHPKKLPMPQGLVNIYINCYHIFGEDVYSETNASVNKLATEIECYYYDDSNSSFYFLPEQLEAGLEKINDWYVTTKGSIDSILKQKKIAKLQAELLNLTEVK
jgi:hypothetical protein